MSDTKNTKTFLAWAREMPDSEKRFQTRAELAKKCWQEILAVVESATEVERDFPTTSGNASEPYRRNRLWHALDALDRKAGE